MSNAVVRVRKSVVLLAGSVMLFTVMSTSCFLLPAEAAAHEPSDICAVREDALLALDEKAFDQDLNGGWRTLAANPACRLKAADLILRYRQIHGTSSRMLMWHEGQLRAASGQIREAIDLFQQTRLADDATGWNFYVDATVAFLKGDRQGLDRARLSLSQLLKPEDFGPVGPDGQPISIPWPPNLNVVDGLIACFGRPYSEAYASPCTVPIRVERP